MPYRVQDTSGTIPSKLSSCRWDHGLHVGENSDSEITSLARRSIMVRKLVLEMIQRAGSGHIGSSLSCVDIMSTLKFSEMNLGDASDRDVFVLSKGHAVPAW